MWVKHLVSLVDILHRKATVWAHTISDSSWVRLSHFLMVWPLTFLRTFNTFLSLWSALLSHIRRDDCVSMLLRGYPDPKATIIWAMSWALPQSRCDTLLWDGSWNLQPLKIGILFNIDNQKSRGTIFYGTLVISQWYISFRG